MQYHFFTPPWTKSTESENRKPRAGKSLLGFFGGGLRVRLKKIILDESIGMKLKHKTIFIVDPVKNERIHLAKFLKHELFTILAFVSVPDCFKQAQLIGSDLIVFVVRKDKSELKHLLNIKKKYKKKYIILYLTPEAPDVNLADLREQGFPFVHKANSQEKVREITLGLLAPDGLPPRTETPHPVPITFDPLENSKNVEP